MLVVNEVYFFGRLSYCCALRSDLRSSWSSKDRDSLGPRRQMADRARDSPPMSERRTSERPGISIFVDVVGRGGSMRCGELEFDLQKEKKEVRDLEEERKEEQQKPKVKVKATARHQQHPKANVFK